MSEPKAEGRVVLGLQPVREAIRVHGARIERLLVEKGSPTMDALARFAKDNGATPERVSRAELDKLARGGRHQGVIAFVPALRIVAEEEIDPSLVVALDELEDPQNFGAVIRSAVAWGATAVLFPEHHAAPLTPATFRASAGAVEHATLCRVPSLPRALEALKARGARVVGLDAQAKRAIAECELTTPTVLVVGAEGKGLRKPVKAACDELVRLPMGGPVASLNASVALGIALYEATRQRA
ncbi:MAG: 23S rRNA (guanosine(2251)-2'-O)-methyltransferase RlmB [Myxococcales bacterium]|nr:23S rRNA (guanosine(2251)-2'-O)-methyltransferase RlmB [Myxococcales bacterium]